MMDGIRFYIVITAHNEEDFIGLCLDSLLAQDHHLSKIVVVDDHSTDATADILKSYEKEHSNIQVIHNHQGSGHLPGAKVVRAFYKGFESLDQHYDVICKFDADLIFPKHYFSTLNKEFQQHKNLGMAGGFCYTLQEGEWLLEKSSDNDHLRGALKAYRKNCFKDIKGLRKNMGWDTVDELLARCYGWEVKTLPALKVKHLRPTGKVYKASARFKRGQAFYQMRLGYVIATISALKNAYRQNNISAFIDDGKGYFRAKQDKVMPFVTKKEGQFIRKYRLKRMLHKLLPF